MIKKKYRDKQNALKQLIVQKKMGAIVDETFHQKLNELQSELTELEFKIIKMRIG